MDIDANETARTGEIEMHDYLLKKEEDDIDNQLLQKRGDLELMRSLGEIQENKNSYNYMDFGKQVYPEH